MAESTHVLRIECPDEKGLVYKVTEVLFKKGLNIVNNAEFVDHANRRFFMRTEFSGSVDSKSVLKSLRSRLPEGAAVEIARERKKDVVVLGSSEPHCVGDLLLRHANGELPARVLARYRNRVINIHHSFLPAFVGANPYRQASERGVKIIGATAHYVNEELDMGPIIAQGVIPVDHSHSAVDMAQAGRDVEKIVLARALKLAFEDRIFVSGNKTVIFD